VAGKTLRASEIAQFTFCHRAWWYARQGHPSDNLEWQHGGDRWHRGHGQAVLVAGFLRMLGYGFLLAAVASAAAYLTALVLG
jgi:hypothetical protein